MATRQYTGKFGEKVARRYLRRQGYQLIALNWRCPAGEIDIIAYHLDRHCLVFAEVRARIGAKYGTAQESISPRKMAHWSGTANAFIDQYRVNFSMRCDFICLDKKRTVWELRHLRDISLEQPLA